MKTVSIDIEELRKLIQESVREVFDSKMKELLLNLLPYVSDEEQKEIEKMFGEPDDDDDVANVVILEHK